MNWMCHPSLSVLRACFHKILPSWKMLFSTHLSFLLLLLFWHWRLQFFSVHSRVNTRTGAFDFFCFVASVPVFLWFSTLSILHLFCLILPIVSYISGIHLSVRVSLQIQYCMYFPQASQNYFGMQRDWKTLCGWAAKTSLVSRWCLWQGHVLELAEEPRAGSCTWSAGDLGIPRFSCMLSLMPVSRLTGIILPRLSCAWKSPTPCTG